MCQKFSIKIRKEKNHFLEYPCFIYARYAYRSYIFPRYACSLFVLFSAFLFVLFWSIYPDNESITHLERNECQKLSISVLRKLGQL